MNKLMNLKFNDFIKKKKIEAKERRRKLIPRDIIDTLYSSPQEFIDSMSLTIPSLISKGNLFDEDNTSLIMHYLIAYESSLSSSLKDIQAIYTQGMIPFFQSMQSVLSQVNEHNETFLHIYSRKRNKKMLFELFAFLCENNLISQSLIKQMNSDGKMFYEYVFDEMKETRIAKDESYQKFFSQFKTHCVNYIWSKDALLLNSFLIQNTIDLKRLKAKETKEEELKNLIQIMKDTPELYIDITYYPKISFNLLNYLIDSNDIASALMLVNEYNKLLPSKVGIITNSFKYTIAKGKGGEDELIAYLKQLLTIIKDRRPQDMMVLKRQDKMTKRNIFHHLFSNTHLNNNAKVALFDFLCDKLFNNSNDEINRFLSQKDNIAIHPLVYYITSIEVDQSNKEQVEKFFNQYMQRSNITIEYSSKAYTSYEAFFAFLDANRQLNLNMILNYFLNNNLLDVLYKSKRPYGDILLTLFTSSSISKENFDIILNASIKGLNLLTSNHNQQIKTVTAFASRHLELFSDESICSLFSVIETSYKNHDHLESPNNSYESLINNLSENPNKLNAKVDVIIQELGYKVAPACNERFIKKIMLSEQFTQITIEFIFERVIAFTKIKHLLFFFLNLFAGSIYTDSKYAKGIKAFINTSGILIKRYLIQNNIDGEIQASFFFFCFKLQCFIMQRCYHSEGELFVYFTLIKQIHINARYVFNFSLFPEIPKDNKNILLLLSKQSGLLYKPKKNTLSEYDPLILVCFLPKEQFNEVYDDYLFKIDLPKCSLYHQMLLDIVYDEDDDNNNNISTIDIPNIDFDQIKEETDKNLKIKLYDTIISLFNKKYKNRLMVYNYILTQIAQREKNKEGYIDIKIKGLIHISKILPLIAQEDDLTHDQEIILAKNFIIPYEKLKSISMSMSISNCNKKAISKKASAFTSKPYDEQMRLYYSFIKADYKNRNFALKIIQNRHVHDLFSEQYQEVDKDHLMLFYIFNSIKHTDNLKQEMISHFNPSVLLFNSFAYLAFNSSFISYNPFSFLLNSAMTDSDCEYYSKFLMQINNDQRVLFFQEQQSSKYICSPSNLQNQYNCIDNRKLNQFINNIITFNSKTPQLSVILSNVTFNEAFCDLVYHSIANFRTRKIADIAKLIEAAIQLNILSYNTETSSKVYLMFIILIKNNESKLATEHQLIKDKALSVVPSLSTIYFKHLSQTIKQIIFNLLCMKDITFFEVYIQNIIMSFKASIVSQLFKDTSLQSIIISYFIFKDDVALVKKILELINITPQTAKQKGKELLTSKLSLNTLFIFQSISKCNNNFTKFLFKYNKSTLYYLAIIASSQSVVYYIADEYVSFDDLRELNETQLNDLNYDLRKSIFASRNMNYFLEFNDLIKFDNFSHKDYYYLSRLYQTKAYYYSFIKAISFYFPLFDPSAFFICCVMNDNREMAMLLFKGFTIKEKQSVLSHIDVFPNDTNENIIHYLIMKNYNSILSELKGLIKLYSKEHLHLLFEYYDTIGLSQSDMPVKSIKFIKNINTISIEHWTRLKSPIQYSLIYRNYESFAILYEFYPRDYIVILLNNFPSTMSYYLEYIRNEQNRQTIKGHAPNLYLISESIICLREYLETFDIDYHRDFNQIASFLFTNPLTFKLNDNIEKINFNSNKTISFCMLHLFINVFNIFPSETVFDFLFSDGDYLRFKNCSEATILFILNSMEKLGFKIISVNKNIASDYGDEYVRKIDVNRMKSLKEYQKFIWEKTKNYSENQKIYKKITENPLKCLINVINLGFFNIAFALINEYDLIYKLTEINDRERIMLEKVFLSFQYQVVNYFENTSNGNTNQVDILKRVFAEKWEVSTNETKPFFHLLVNFNQYFKETAKKLSDKVQRRDAYEDMIKDIHYVRIKIQAIIQPNSFYSQYFSNKTEATFKGLFQSIYLKELTQQLYLNFTQVYKQCKVIPNYCQDYYDYYFNSNYMKEQMKACDKYNKHQSYLELFLKLNHYLEYISSFILELKSIEGDYRIKRRPVWFNHKEKQSFNEAIASISNSVIGNITITFNYEDKAEDAKTMMKQNWTKVAKLIGKHIALRNHDCKEEAGLVFPYYFNANEMKIFDPILNHPLKYSINAFMNQVNRLLTLILYDDYLGPFILSYPSIYFPFIQNCGYEDDIKTINAIQFEELRNYAVAELRNQPDLLKTLTYLYALIENNAVTLKDLITKTENSSVLALVQYYIPISFEEISLLFISHSFIQDEAKALFFKKSNFGFSTCQEIISNQIYASKLDYPQLKPIEFLFPNSKLFKLKFNEFIQAIGGMIGISNNYKDKQIQVNYFEIGRLIENYIKANPLWKVNKQLDDVKIKQLLEKTRIALKYVMFNMDNSLIVALADLALILKEKLKVSDRFIIEVSEDVNLTNTIEFKSLSVLDQVFEVNRIEYGIIKDNDNDKEATIIRMKVIIDGSLLKIPKEGFDKLNKMVDDITHYKIAFNQNYNKLTQDKFIEEQVNAILKKKAN